MKVRIIFSFAHHTFLWQTGSYFFIYTPSSNPDLSLYFRPRCGFGFFSKSDFSAIFFSHFFSSSDSFFKFNLSRLQINAKDACSGSPSSLAASSAACKNPFSGLSSGTLKKSSLWASRRSRAILFISCCIT